MRSFLLSLAQAFGIVLLADFLAGVIHWIEDAYFTEDTPVIGPAFIKPNIVHHHLPRYFTKLTWWQSSADLLAVGVLMLGAGWWFGFLSWQLWLFVAVSVNANQVHKWSHRTRKENGPVISFFQDIRVLQTPHQHALHHTDPKNTYYCPVTNLVNPALERIHFWDHAENLVERLTGLKHRDDTSNRGAGPGPEWLAEFRPARPAIASAPSAKNSATDRRTPCGRVGVCDCAHCPRRAAHSAVAQLERAA